MWEWAGDDTTVFRLTRTRPSPTRSTKGRTLSGSVSGHQVTLTGRGLVQAHGSSNEVRESLLVDFIVLVEIDCAPGVAFEA